MLPGRCGITGVCTNPPAPPTPGDGIGIGMLPLPPVIGVGMGTCPEAGLGTIIIWPGGGTGADLGVLGVPRLAPMKGVEPACPWPGMGMGMFVPGGITGPCGGGGAGSGLGIGIGEFDGMTGGMCAGDDMPPPCCDGCCCCGANCGSGMPIPGGMNGCAMELAATPSDATGY